MPALSVGAAAPNFTLDGSAGPTTLSAVLHQHRYAVLVFFPHAFSSVCTDELNVFQEAQEEFARLDAQVLGISVDSKYAQQAFAQANNLSFPLLADFHPRGAVAQQYGVMREEGAAERALFIVDRELRVRYSFVSEPSQNPGAGGVLDALEALQGGQA